MGDPKKSRRKYTTPAHPWEAERIRQEDELKRKYGLKNKKELWKVRSVLGNVRAQARSLQARSRYGDEQAFKEIDLLLERLDRLGMLPKGSSLDEVLTLDIESILGRRFQTLTYIRGLAHTPKQARQFIVHGHIAINGRKVTIPGYLVPREDEDTIFYHDRSPLMNDQHPMRPQAEPLTEDRASSVERTIDLSGGEEEEGDEKAAASGEGGA